MVNIDVALREAAQRPSTSRDNSFTQPIKSSSMKPSTHIDQSLKTNANDILAQSIEFQPSTSVDEKPESMVPTTVIKLKPDSESVLTKEKKLPVTPTRRPIAIQAFRNNLSSKLVNKAIDKPASSLINGNNDNNDNRKSKANSKMTEGEKAILKKVNIEVANGLHDSDLLKTPTPARTINSPTFERRLSAKPLVPYACSPSTSIDQRTSVRSQASRRDVSPRPSTSAITYNQVENYHRPADGIPEPKTYLSCPIDCIKVMPNCYLAFPSLRNTDPSSHCTLNICFANVVIQTLAHVPALVRAVLMHSKKWMKKTAHNSKSCTLCQFNCLLDAIRQQAVANFSLYDQKKPVIDIRTYLQIAKYIPERYHRGQQHDSHEFFISFVDAMNENAIEFYKKIHDQHTLDTNSIFQIFGGYWCSSVVCQCCKTKSTRFESFFDIQIEMNSAMKSILDCLRSTTQSERLYGDNAYSCDKCRAKTPAEKSLFIHRVPYILAIQLKRYNHDGFRKYATKINQPIFLKDTLDMTSYLSPESADRNRCQYRLQAVICHNGYDLNNGHYYAYVYASNENQWYRCSDTSIVKVPSIQAINASDSYMVFYQRTTPPCQRWVSSSTSSTKEKIAIPNVNGDNGENKKPTLPVIVNGTTPLPPSPLPKIKIVKDRSTGAYQTQTLQALNRNYASSSGDDDNAIKTNGRDQGTDQNNKHLSTSKVYEESSSKLYQDWVLPNKEDASPLSDAPHSSSSSSTGGVKNGTIKAERLEFIATIKKRDRKFETDREPDAKRPKLINDASNVNVRTNSETDLQITSEVGTKEKETSLELNGERRKMKKRIKHKKRQERSRSPREVEHRSKKHNNNRNGHRHDTTREREHHQENDRDPVGRDNYSKNRTGVNHHRHLNQTTPQRRTHKHFSNGRQYSPNEHRHRRERYHRSSSDDSYHDSDDHRHRHRSASLLSSGMRNRRLHL